jgi:signal transduction histidine kinase
VSRRRNQEVQKANHLLSEANAELLRADREKTTFLSTVVHELQIPVTSIQGFTALVLDDAHLDSTTRDYVDRIARNAEALSKLVTELHEFSRLGRGEISLALEPVSLSSLAPQIVDQLAAVAGDHPIHLDIQPDVTVRADPDAVRRIMTNLFTNAVKFSPPRAEIGVTVHAAGGVGVISILDEGPGISDHEEQVFELFYHGRPGGEHMPGLGIGLAVVRQLTERMGGSVALANRAEGGARFSVRLPLASPSPEGPSRD